MPAGISRNSAIPTSRSAERRLTVKTGRHSAGRIGTVSPPRSFTRVQTWLLVISVPAATLIAVFATGFGSSGAPGGAPAVAAGRDTVVIDNFAFSPRLVSVPIGTTVAVLNEDQTAHTFTADNHDFDTGTVRPGDTSRVTIARPGDFRYHCEIHPFMTGIVLVSPQRRHP